MEITQIINGLTIKLLDKLDGQCWERDQLLELCSVLAKKEITKATEATAKVLKKVNQRSEAMIQSGRWFSRRLVKKFETS